jgi:hypothetical protein
MHGESKPISRKARGTLFGLELRVREIRGTRHRSGMTDGSAMGPKVVWVSYPVDLGKIADARRGDSDEACGKHGTQQQTRALEVGQVV